MQLVVGTYERFLLGYHIPDDLEAAGGVKLQQAFTHASHQAPVCCVDAAGPFVVSGGRDDQLHLYDVKRGRDLGFLMNPGEGAVPCLQLYMPPGASSPTHLFSGSADGGIAIWRAGGEWEHLKMMKGHKGAVNGLAVHPTGRLALSVAHDRQIRMWDLIRGRCTYTAGLDAEGLDVQFGPGGDHYSLMTDNTLTLHAAGGGGGLVARVDSEEARFTCVGRGRQDERVLLVGMADGGLSLWDTREGGTQLTAVVTKAHKTRLRAIIPVTQDAGAPLPRHIATASSDGTVKVWDCRKLGTQAGGGSCREVASVDTRGRITCLALSAPGRKQPALAGGAQVAGEEVAKQTDQQQQQQQQKKKEQKPTKPAPPDDSDDQKDQQQQQQRQRQLQPRLQPQAQRQPKQHQKRAQQPKPKQPSSSGAGGDEALVPRIQTIIKKKKTKGGEREGQRQQARGGGSISIVNRKAPRQGRKAA